MYSGIVGITDGDVFRVECVENGLYFLSDSGSFEIELLNVAFALRVAAARFPLIPTLSEYYGPDGF